MHCHACGKPIEADSLFCRLCGTRQPRAPVAPVESASPGGTTQDTPPGPRPLWIIGGLTVLACIIALGLATTTRGDRPPRSTDVVSNLSADDALADIDALAPSANIQAAEEAPAPAPPEPWTYSTTEDKVRGATSYFASTTSTNSVELDAPYDGGSTLRMTVRKSPAHGADVILLLSSGQLLCRAYDGCYATVRFDGDPAERVELVEASDNSSDTVFVSEASPFIAKLRKAKRVIVELEIYEAGRPQFEFDIAGLKWNH
jgi:hypothetical protein